MFDSTPAGVRPVLTLEPWATDYGSAFEADEEEADEPSAYEIDPFFESASWQTGIDPRPLAWPQSVAFVDGVQRVDYWARIDNGETSAEAALATVAAGATISEQGASR